MQIILLRSIFSVGIKISHILIPVKGCILNKAVISLIFIALINVLWKENKNENIIALIIRMLSWLCCSFCSVADKEVDLRSYQTMLKNAKASDFFFRYFFPPTEFYNEFPCVYKQ